LSNRAIGLAKLVLVLSIVVCAQTSTVQADEFRRLSAVQIQRLIVGKRITDDTHWSQTVAPGGKLLFRDMDRTSTAPGS
jgi:hypothetical protein